MQITQNYQNLSLYRNPSNQATQSQEDSTPTLDRETRFLALAAKFTNDIEKAMKAQGISDVSKLDKAIFNQVRRESSLESDTQKVQELLNETIFALQNDRVKSGNLSKGAFESQAQFEARKAKTIDILSEILQGIKA